VAGKDRLFPFMYPCIGPVLILFRSVLLYFLPLCGYLDFSDRLAFWAEHFVFGKKGTYAFALELGETSIHLGHSESAVISQKSSDW